MKECPFCGANGYKTNYGYRWDCNTEKVGTSFIRSFPCYETQLAAQTKLLGKCLEMVRKVIKAKEQICLMGVMSIAIVSRAAQILLPELEKAIKEK